MINFQKDTPNDLVNNYHQWLLKYLGCIPTRDTGIIEGVVSILVILTWLRRLRLLVM